VTKRQIEDAQNQFSKRFIKEASLARLPYFRPGRPEKESGNLHSMNWNFVNLP
jgi:hypothetical protein